MFLVSAKILVRQKWQCLRRLSLPLNIMGMANGVLFFFHFVHLIKLTRSLLAASTALFKIHSSVNVMKKANGVLFFFLCIN
jgi:hypothetical protein